MWRNGNEYVGEWRNGVINGRGVLVFGNGNRYEGHWENGVLTGGDVEMRSFFDGIEKRKRSSVDVGGCGGDKVFPRICIWESDGEAGDITCDIVDDVEASVIYRDRLSVDLGFRQFRKKNPCCFSGGGEAKKPGETISKGHKKYDLMLNLQHGIR